MKFPNVSHRIKSFATLGLIFVATYGLLASLRMETTDSTEAQLWASRYQDAYIVLFQDGRAVMRVDLVGETYSAMAAVGVTFVAAVLARKSK